MTPFRALVFVVLGLTLAVAALAALGLDFRDRLRRVEMDLDLVVRSPRGGVMRSPTVVPNGDALHDAQMRVSSLEQRVFLLEELASAATLAEHGEDPEPFDPAENEEPVADPYEITPTEQARKVVMAEAELVKLEDEFDRIGNHLLREKYDAGEYRVLREGEARPGGAAFCTQIYHPDGTSTYIAIDEGESRDLHSLGSAIRRAKRRLCDLEAGRPATVD